VTIEQSFPQAGTPSPERGEHSFFASYCVYRWGGAASRSDPTQLGSGSATVFETVFWPSKSFLARSRRTPFHEH